MARVLIAVPTFETITPDTFKALWDMDKGGHECLFDFVRGYDCATARNNIAQRAMELGAEWLLMVDNDVAPPVDALVNLMEHGEDAVTGYYAHRGAANLYEGRTCVCRLTKPDGTYYFNYPLESEYTGAEMREMRERGENLVRVHGGGMGCMLVRVDVFRRLDYPWFDWVNYADDHRGMLSEDLYFCEKLRADFTPMHVDTRVECGHVFRHMQMCD